MVNLSWISDSLSDMYSSNLKKTTWLFDAFGAKNAYTDFVESEIAKADLRGAEAETFMKGLPIIGGVVNGIDGIQELEDLYNNTGKVPAYPASNSPGAQGLASAATGITRKIEDGLHDLGEYYAGDRDLNNVFENQGHPVVKHGTGLISKYGGF